MTKKYFALTVVLDEGVCPVKVRALVEAVQKMRYVRVVIPHDSNSTKRERSESELLLKQAV